MDASENLLSNTSAAATAGRMTSVQNTSSGDMFDAKVMEHIILSDSSVIRENSTADAREIPSSGKNCDVVYSDDNNCCSSGNKDSVTVAALSARATLGTHCSSGKNSFVSPTVPPTWSSSSLEHSFLNWDWNSVVGFFDSHQTSYDQKQQSGYNDFDMNGSLVETLGLGSYYPSNSYFYPSNGSNFPSTTRDWSTYYPTEEDYGLEYFDGLYYSPPMNYCHPSPSPPGGCGYETSAHNLKAGGAPKPYDNCYSLNGNVHEKNPQNNHYSLNRKYPHKYRNNTHNTNNNNNKWKYYQNTNNKSSVGNESFGYPQKQERFANSSNTSHDGSSYSSSWTRNVNDTYVVGGEIRNNGSWDVHDGYKRTRNNSWDVHIVHDGGYNRTGNNSWDVSSGPFGTRNCWRADFDSYGARSDDKSYSSSSSVGSSYYDDESDKTERPSVWFRFPTPETHSEE
uniref:Uncharacterized protein n=1 Tax=Cacopsylla melanoneura TaxID=428564 RepID=A0A8D8RZ40_9HEMI